MAQPRRTVPKTTSMATGQMALREVLTTRGLSMEALASNFMTPVRLAIASTPLRARMTPANATHCLEKGSEEGLRCSMERWGMLSAMIKRTTTTMGIAMVIARLPLCLGPNQLMMPTRR